MQMNSRVTMADIARSAGVSLMTVSRVINHKDGVSRETRQRIEQIISELDYRPSSIARSLATRRTGTLGLVVPDISNPFFSGVARGVDEVATAHGFSVLLCNTEEEYTREVDMLQLLEEKRVDGVVLCSSRLDAKVLIPNLARHSAVVLVNRVIDNLPKEISIGAVYVNCERGGGLATAHLIERGHHKIGILSGPPASFSGQQRMRGYRAALDNAGIPFRLKYTLSCIPSVEGGCQAAHRLLSAHPELTALVCYNDLVAVGALQACSELGLKVPDQVAVVGFDDIFLAALVTPALTTCQISTTKLGATAAKVLLERIQGCQQPCQNIVLEPHLVIRASAP
jgi:LacI family transcriptional regulator